MRFPWVATIMNCNPERERRGKPVLWQLMERSVTLRMEDRGQQESNEAQVNGEMAEIKLKSGK